MDDNQRAELARQEFQRQETVRQMQAELRSHDKRCPTCSGSSPTGGPCVVCQANERKAAERAHAGLRSHDKRCPTCSGSSPTGGPCVVCQANERIVAEQRGSANLLEDQLRAFQSRFSESPELDALWLQASQDTVTFEKTRAKFWELVNHDSSTEAGYVRNLLEAAGFELDTGTRAPMLDMAWDDRRETRMDAARRLSIDHAIPQSRDQALSMEASNLRFMLQDDNSRRGARFNDNDHRYDDVCPSCWVRSPGGVECQTCIENKTSGPRYLPEV